MIEMPFGSVTLAREVARDLMRDEGFVSHMYRGVVAEKGPELTLHFSGRRRFSADSHMFFSCLPVRVALPEPREPHGTLRFLFERRQPEPAADEGDINLRDTFMTKADASHPSVFAPHVDAVLVLEATMDEQLEKLRSHGTRKKMQGLLRRGVSWRLSTEVDDLHHFYTQMYLPTVRARFGPEGSVTPLGEMESAFVKGGSLLLTINDDGSPQGGALLSTAPHHPGLLHYWKTGVAECMALPPPALTECYARVETALLQYAVLEGFRELHFGVTRAIANDGVFIHKKRLGCTFRNNATYLSAELHVRPAARATVFSVRPVLTWLGNNPSCSAGHVGGLETAAKVSALKEYLHLCAVPGMNRVTLHVEGSLDSLETVRSTAHEAAHECGCPIDVVVT